MTIFDRIHGVRWMDHAQPEWNKPGSVAAALCRVHSANDAASSSAAYDNLLYAIGNNHAGTYYPVLLAVLPFMEELLAAGGFWPRNTVLCVLDDLFASFQPEPGHEEVRDLSGGQLQVAAAFAAHMRGLRPLLGAIVTGGGPHARLAAELLDMLAEHDAGSAGA